jgi:hypothetical protein
MASGITVKGQRPRKGKKMTKVTRWRIVAVTGKKRVFIGTLLKTINFGKKRIAIFSVRK